MELHWRAELLFPKIVHQNFLRKYSQFAAIKIALSDQPTLVEPTGSQEDFAQG
jgi:hypothetical protein